MLLFLDRFVSGTYILALLMLRQQHAALPIDLLSLIHLSQAMIPMIGAVIVTLTTILLGSLTLIKIAIVWMCLMKHHHQQAGHQH